MILAFQHTVKDLRNGKTTTCRKEKSYKNWAKEYENDRAKWHEAYDKNPRSGGKQIGEFMLTQPPELLKIEEMRVAHYVGELLLTVKDSKADASDFEKYKLTVLQPKMLKILNVIYPLEKFTPQTKITVLSFVSVLFRR